jgi:hypothetical protein
MDWESSTGVTLVVVVSLIFGGAAWYARHSAREFTQAPACSCPISSVRVSIDELPALRRDVQDVQSDLRSQQMRIDGLLQRVEKIEMRTGASR